MTDTKNISAIAKEQILRQVFLRSTYGEELHKLTHVLLFALETIIEERPKNTEAHVGQVVLSIFSRGYELSEENQKKFTDCEFKNDEEELKTLDNIEKYAGSFVKQLGTCYRFADPQNKQKLRSVFWDYFQLYLPEKWSKNT